MDSFKIEIENLINAAVDRKFAEAMKLNVPTPAPIRSANLDPNDAIEYLNSIGYKCSLSQLYKASAKCEIPFTKYGRKLTFQGDELTKWVDSKKSKIIDISLVVAASANLKLGRVNK